MDTSQIIWIVVAVVVLLVIIGLIAYFAKKKNKARQLERQEADRRKAADIRQTAQATELGAREREAQAHRQQVDAEQAEIEAERTRMEADRMRREAEARSADAKGIRDEAQSKLRDADEVDPDVNTDKRSRGGRGDTHGRDDRNTGPVEPDRGDEGRHVARDGGADDPRRREG